MARDLYDKMRDGIGIAAIGTAVIAVIFIVLVIAPFILIWAINTLAEAGGSSFHVPFTFWTWLAGFVLILLFRGTGSTEMK